MKETKPMALKEDGHDASVSLVRASKMWSNDVDDASPAVGRRSSTVTFFVINVSVG